MKNNPTPIRAAVFDFDGTLSTLRHGWEKVMAPLMRELLAAGEAEKEESFREEIDRYIDYSTGIQTIRQMKWLSARVAWETGLPPVDPWQYKAEYDRRLLAGVNARVDSLLRGDASAEDYLIAGSAAFVRALKDKGVLVFAASGTDHPCVLREAEALGVKEMFDRIDGAPVGVDNCSKEAVLRRLLAEEGFTKDDIAVLGDGPVEIRLGREIGARTVGIASDEEARRGVNPVKLARLEKAGAGLIVGDFSDQEAILAYLGLA